MLLYNFFKLVAKLPISVFSGCEGVHNFELEIKVLWVNIFGKCEDFFGKFDAFVHFVFVEVLVELKK